jgi:hypothetical protein
VVFNCQHKLLIGSKKSALKLKIRNCAGCGNEIMETHNKAAPIPKSSSTDYTPAVCGKEIPSQVKSILFRYPLGA